jgi:hypothetical protein
MLLLLLLLCCCSPFAGHCGTNWLGCFPGDQIYRVFDAE